LSYSKIKKPLDPNSNPQSLPRSNGAIDIIRLKSETKVFVFEHVAKVFSFKFVKEDKEMVKKYFN